MARKDARTRTEQVNFRFQVTTIERLEAFRDRHPLRLTSTQIVEAATLAWLDANEPTLPPKEPPAPRKPRT